MKRSYYYLFTVILISAVSYTNAAGVNSEGRWYSKDQVELGRKVYGENCMVCHAPQAKGTKDWMKRDTNGKFPPPPLNGTAHTWHHPISILKRTITEGGIKLGGSMPGFSGKLSEAEMLAAIAYIQTFWNDEIYGVWNKRGGTTR